MKILIPFITLLQITSARASLVGIMDSGTDITHKDLAPKIWINTAEKPGNIDYDHDGLPGDVYGWDFTTNSSSPFDPKYDYLINNDVKTFFTYYAQYEQKTIQPDALNWLKTKSQDANFLNQVNFVGDYIHGTHVAGIASINASAVKLLCYKIIPTVYTDPTTTAPNAGQSSLVDNSGSANQPATIEEFTSQMLDQAKQQVDQMVQIQTIINSKKADVVNQSFGVGYSDATNFIKADFNAAFKRDPTDAELQAQLSSYFNQLLSDGARMYQVAPKTMFVVAAGNDAVNIDQMPDYPSDVSAPNKIVVAATNGYSEIADFSNFGASHVDVAAPGVSITSTAPMNNYISLSGTSQATPFVVNTLAQMKDANPKLSINDMKTILFGTVDVKAWLQGKVRTSGIVNKNRAILAAQLSKTVNVNSAIAQAKTQVADVVVNKSFEFGSLKLEKLDFKPHRASLLIKR